MAKKDPANPHKNLARETSASKPGQVVRSNDRTGHWAVRRSSAGQIMPPPGPSNIIIVTASPLPPPKNVDSQ